MKWRVLISAPYLLPVLDGFRSQLEAAGVEIITADVKERFERGRPAFISGHNKRIHMPSTRRTIYAGLKKR